jgi:transcriptional regulator with XRE-family HTH domain
MASVGKHIRRLRLARHLTQEQLAETLFVTRQTVSAWETNKAQPDLETLERIAAALGAEVTEVIYGAPRSPDLAPIRRRWALAGAALALVVAYVCFLVVRLGIWGSWKYGLDYQFWSQNYNVVTELLPGTYQLELDLSDPASNVGAVLYEDAQGCRITVELVDRDVGGAYRVSFLAEGVCTPSGGQLVSGCYDRRLDKRSHAIERTASMETAVGGEACGPSYYYLASTMGKSENRFGFFIFPIEQYERGELILSEELAAQDGHVTISVTGLTRMTTQRLPGLQLF